MNRISTHILDVALGKPAANVPVRLERRQSSGDWLSLSSQQTGADGRCPQLLPPNEVVSAGQYRLHFDIAAYFQAQQAAALYPFIEVVFQVTEGQSEFHIPLLLSPYGYTTYRGS